MVKRLQREKQKLRAQIDTNEKDLDHYDAINNQIKQVESDKKKLEEIYLYEQEVIESTKTVIQKTFVDSGKE